MADIRDTPPPLIVPAPIDDAGLDVWTFRAVCHVGRRAGVPGGTFYEGRTKAARACGMSVAQWKRALRRLIAWGVLVSAKTTQGFATAYTFHPDRVPTEPGSTRTGVRGNRGPVEPDRGLPEPGPGSTRAIKESREGVLEGGTDSAAHAPLAITPAPLKNDSASKALVPATAVDAEIMTPSRVKQKLIGDCIAAYAARTDGVVPRERTAAGIGSLFDKGKDPAEITRAWIAYLVGRESRFVNAQEFARDFGYWSQTRTPTGPPDPKGALMAKLAADVGRSPAQLLRPMFDTAEHGEEQARREAAQLAREAQREAERARVRTEQLRASLAKAEAAGDAVTVARIKDVLGKECAA